MGEANGTGLAPGAGRDVARDLRCARCGYDVSGAVDSWAGSCPVEGVCPECGLRFEWREVFDPLRDVPRWFFELARKRRAVALVSTAVRTLMPWKFWGDVKMSFPFRHRALAVYAIAGLLFAWLVIAGVQVFAFSHGQASYYGSYWRAYSSVQTVDLVFEALVWPMRLLGQFTWIWGEVSFAGAWWAVGMLVVLTPAGFLVLGETLGRARVRREHVLRAAVHVGMGVVLLYTGLTVVRGACCWIAFRRMSYGYSHQWGSASRWWAGVAEHWFEYEYDIAAFFVVWVWLSWWVVCRRYFRVDRPALVALAITAMAGLATAVVVCATDAGMRWAMLIG